MELNPQDTEALAGRGHIYRVFTDRLDLALQDFNLALSLHPTNPHNEAYIYCQRGAIYTTMGETEKAFADLNLSLEIYPESICPYFNLGSWYYAMGRYEESVQSFDKAIALNEDENAAYFLRGESYMALQNYQAAIDDFTHVLDNDPNFMHAQVERGRAYDKIGDSASAENDYDVVTNRFSTDYEAYYLVALALMERGNYDGYYVAREYLRSASYYDESQANPYWALGNVEVQLGNFDAAMQAYQHYLNLAPNPDPRAIAAIQALQTRLGTPTNP